MTTLHRSFAMLRRMQTSSNMTPLRCRSAVVAIGNKHRSSWMRPHYIGIRGYFNPQGDWLELSETAWKEKRMYRYYKFSERLSVSQQGRGHFAGILTVSGLLAAWMVTWWFDIQVASTHFWYRQWRDEEIKPWCKLAGKNGYLNAMKFSRHKMKEVFDEKLPAIRETHDGLTKKEYARNMTLFAVRDRQPDFDEQYLFGPFEFEMVPEANPAYHKFIAETKSQ
mmetsp:Transcript_21875/g.35161  ORF Transcript_21875/g.35161 Transcript_21875/m.35161 type:complete len:223 (-) Transcript_21875:187-855(-)